MARTPYKNPEDEAYYQAISKQRAPNGSDGNGFIEDRDVDTERGIVHPNAPAYEPQTPGNFRKRR